MINEWPDIENFIKSVKEFLYGHTYLKSKKSLKSYLALIPLIYFHYHYPNKSASVKHVDNYLLRTLLAGSFGGSPDALIDNGMNHISEKKDFYCSGRSLRISKRELLKQSYFKKNDSHLIFNIWYQNVNYNPAYLGNELQIDHIFPTNLLKKVKPSNT